MRILRFLFVFFVSLNASCIIANRDRQYFEAIKEVRLANLDFAFMKLNDYLRENPNSIHTKEIKFAIAEYYLQLKDYRDGIYRLLEYIRDYSQDNSAIFAKMLLYKAVLEYKNQPEFIEKIKKEFFSQSLFLIFSESKEKSYTSILNNDYRIVDYVDRIEVFKNNDLILKISP